MSRRAIEGEVTPPGTIERMTPVRRILKLVGAALAFVRLRLVRGGAARAGREAAEGAAAAAR